MGKRTKLAVRGLTSLSPTLRKMVPIAQQKPASKAQESPKILIDTFTFLGGVLRRMMPTIINPAPNMVSQVTGSSKKRAAISAVKRSQEL
jgi:hypothetical protein